MVARMKFVLQEWKQGRGQIGLMQPKFQEKADMSDQTQPRAPQMKLCQMNENGHLSIPKDVREKWLNDPVRRSLICWMSTCLCCFFSCLGSSLMLMIWWVIWCLVFSSKILIGESVWRTLTRSLHLQMKQADLSHGKQMQIGTWPRKSRNLLWVLGWHVRPRQSFQKKSSSPSIPVLMPHLLWTWVSTSHAMWWLGRSSSQVPRRFSFPVCSQRRPNRFSCTLVEVGFQNQQRSLWFKQKFSVFHIKCFFWNSVYPGSLPLIYLSTVKAQDFLSKAANEAKAIEFRLESADAWVSYFNL